MTKRELEIIKILKENPLISQNELADMLEITRSSVGVHISNLIKKGYIKGKGYIIDEDPYVCILGGANMDIQGFPNNYLIDQDSNPGSVKVSLGGVGRNIAENLVKLGVRSKLITVLGDDLYSKEIVEHSKEIGLEIEESLFLKNHIASTYLSILTDTGDMQLAISSMDIYSKIDVDYIKKKEAILNAAKVCVIDTNMPVEVIEYTVKNITNQVYFLDTVSSTKALKIKELIGYFHTIKPNKTEAEMLSGVKIETNEDLDKAADYFLRKGVKQVFISLGPEGVYYNNGKTKGFIPGGEVKLINATGAGDAFVAGLVYSYMKDFDIDQAAKFAQAASILTIGHEDTINPQMNVENVNQIKKERSDVK